MDKSAYQILVKNRLKPPPDDSAIASTVSTVFADMVSRAHYEFMLNPDPLVYSFTADVYEYDKALPGCDRILVIAVKEASETVYSPLDCYGRVHFRAIQAGEIPVERGCWTLAGINANGLYRLWFYPAPVSGSFAIDYLMVPSDAALNRMPERWGGVLVDGCLARLAADENARAQFAGYFEKGAGRMAQLEHKITEVLRPYVTNDYDARRMRENADLQ